MRLFDDTSPEAEAFLVERLRSLSPAQKLRRVQELNRTIHQLALLRIRKRFPDANEREQRLRLASLWLEPEVLKTAFDWDPDQP